MILLSKTEVKVLRYEYLLGSKNANIKLSHNFLIIMNSSLFNIGATLQDIDGH